MRGQHRATHGEGPRRIPLSGGDEAASARLFICAECRAQARFRSCCGRGQIYCAGDCGALVRRRSQQVAGAGFQASRRGQRAHAERAQRYQARPEKLPHHGSLAPVPDDCLPPGSRTVVCGVTNLG
jgi:hypothetical protein